MFGNLHVKNEQYDVDREHTVGECLDSAVAASPVRRMVPTMLRCRRFNDLPAAASGSVFERW